MSTFLVAVCGRFGIIQGVIGGNSVSGTIATQQSKGEGETPSASRRRRCHCRFPSTSTSSFCVEYAVVDGANRISRRHCHRRRPSTPPSSSPSVAVIFYLQTKIIGCDATINSKREREGGTGGNAIIIFIYATMTTAMTDAAILIARQRQRRHHPSSSFPSVLTPTVAVTHRFCPRHRCPLHHFYPSMLLCL